MSEIIMILNDDDEKNIYKIGIIIGTMSIVHLCIIIGVIGDENWKKKI
jgi:hypothetical protein